MADLSKIRKNGVDYDIKDATARAAIEELKQNGTGGNVDLTGYATKQFVRDGFQPKGNYLTEVPEGYAKTEDIPAKPEDIGAQPAGNYLTEVPSDYATKEFVTNKIAEAELGGEEVDLSGYAQKSELPTKVSQLQNDAGYLTAVPDEYAKTADIPTKPSDIGAQPEGDYALRSEIPSVPVKSVNGKTGAVSLTAADVKARPDSWMPTASDVGALPSSTVIPTVPTKVSAFTNDAGYLTEHQDLSEYAKKTEIPSVPVKSVNGKTGAVQLSASDVKARPDNWMPSAQEVGALPNTYTPPNQTAEQVGADPAGTAASAVSQHNTDAAAHNDLRIALQGLSDRINAALDSDDATLDQMSEVVAYIKSNKSLIDAITTSKINVSDIIDNLTTNVSNKPLSAAQGVALKALIDGIVIPEKLPNPYPLTFTGGASGSYDGSKALTINIPSGGDGSTYYVTPEQFGAIGDGVTDDTEAFRQAIETGYPIICMTGKDYYFANEIVTSKTRINIDGNYSHFTAFRLKINLNEDETNWKNPYPQPVSVIQNVYFVNKNNMDYCIKTGIPIKFVNINVNSYDLWLKNYGDYMDYMVFDNLAITSKPSNEHYCIELSYLGDNHVFRECMFVAHNTDIKCVQVSGCKAVNFIDCIINGYVIAYESVVNLNGCHFENHGQIICGDKNVNSVINFNGCLFYDHYSVTPGKNVFYNGCGFLVNYITYGGQNDYMALNTRDCIILCGAESATSDANVIIDELRKNEYPNVVYSGNKVVFTPVVLKHTAKTWGLSAGTYTYKFFQSCNPYSIDYGDTAYSTVEESVTVDADTSAVRFMIDYDAYQEMFIHAYRTAPDGSIKKVVIPINGQYIYDYGETLNGILWKEVESIPTPKSTTAVYHNGIYYSGYNYTNARNCICVDKANGAIVWIDENGNVDLTDCAKEQWVQQNYQPKGEYLTEHQDISGKLDASALPTAINTALAQAKASGEFDGKDGVDGQPGKDGYTPQKGVDYFTDADKEAMVQEVIDATGLKVIGEVDNANNILITANLPDGTYTMRYENADGSTTEIGTFTVGTPVPSMVNLANSASADWLTNKRINSSGDIVDVTEAQRGDDTVVITNYIDMAGVSKLYIKGLDVMSTLSSGKNYGRFYQYNSEKVLQVGAAQPSKLPSGNIWVTKADYDDSVWVVDLVGLNGEWGYSDERYCRWGGILTGAAEDVIITADQKIV